MQVQFDDVLAQHLHLPLVILADYAFLSFCCIELLGEVIGDLLVRLLYLLKLVLPLTILLHHLKTAALAQLVDALHLLGHLADLLE